LSFDVLSRQLWTPGRREVTDFTPVNFVWEAAAQVK
jgi:hypothetical protein